MTTLRSISCPHLGPRKRVQKGQFTATPEGGTQAERGLVLRPVFFHETRGAPGTLPPTRWPFGPLLRRRCQPGADPWASSEHRFVGPLVPGTSLLQEVVYLVSQGADPDEIGLMNIDEQLPVLEYPQPGLDIIKVLWAGGTQLLRGSGGPVVEEEQRKLVPPGSQDRETALSP